jgi:hypothetical protein
MLCYCCFTCHWLSPLPCMIHNKFWNYESFRLSVVSCHNMPRRWKREFLQGMPTSEGYTAVCSNMCRVTMQYMCKTSVTSSIPVDRADGFTTLISVILRMFHSGVLRRIFGTTKCDVLQGRKKSVVGNFIRSTPGQTRPEWLTVDG